MPALVLKNLNAFQNFSRQKLLKIKEDTFRHRFKFPAFYCKKAKVPLMHKMEKRSVFVSGNLQC